MAKVKGGLGESSLIKDLTKPINFHISESLEPPPVYDRRKNAREEALAPEEKAFPELILEKANAMTEGAGIQIVFHLQTGHDSFLLEKGRVSSGPDWRIVSVRGKEGAYVETPWEGSVFSGIDTKDVIGRQAASICLVEVVTDESLINFSSLDDFYEWLEI